MATTRKTPVKKTQKERRKDPVKKTYKKVVTKKSGKTKTKTISAKKYERKLGKAIKKGKAIRNVKSTTTKTPLRGNNITTRTQIVSKTNKRGKTKSFVGQSTKKATKYEVASQIAANDKGIRRKLQRVERAKAAKAMGKQKK